MWAELGNKGRSWWPEQLGGGQSTDPGQELRDTDVHVTHWGFPPSNGLDAFPALFPN